MRPDADLRSDALRNRRALLEAAAEAFAAHGIDAPAAAIARQAGVAKGTLFRHFPTKRDLVAAILADRMLTLCELIEQIRSECEGGLAAVAELMTRGAAMLAADRSFFEAAMREGDGDEGLATARARLVASLDELVVTAQLVGELRDDVTGIDLAMLMMAATNTCAPALEREPQLWRRYLALMIDGLRPGELTVLPVPALAGVSVS
ncbi:MAG TPA: TetR/AcrR family transcriptional regulator [Solirubrobacteraceae bacterium]|jgi:AcrR family transcriptional regulator|nr:TetR/AcrR family transcriptional regulator [Solirubrobacteraceae bacterium]